LGQSSFFVGDCDLLSFTTGFVFCGNVQDKETLTKKIDEVLAWLEGNQQAEKEEFDAKQKELEAVANPIMMKAYQSGGAPPGAGMPEGGMPDFAGAGAGNGPTVEEVD
jgi:L1 cell adhesion molecule like protein